MTYKDKSQPSAKYNERVACPLCGWWRTVNFGISQRTGEPREVRFDKVDLETAPMWRLESLSGAGRASSDARIEVVDSRKLGELSPEYKSQIRQQCRKILEILEEAENE